ncbi:4-hydroxy-tetrahydrodipicolinate synthase [bacterium]|nr:4-hydroxy-tetrahydrodipicolinate synthase [bacterium]
MAAKKKNNEPVFGNVVTAIVTPFNKRGAVDYNQAEKLFKHVQAQNDGIVVAGTTGEGPTLSQAEKLKLFEFYKSRAKKGFKVLLNVGSNDTADSVKFAKAAAKAGADGLMVVGPYYNKPNADGQLAHFSAISDASDLPILLYNIPGRTGLRVEHDVIIELAGTSNVCAVKDATGDLAGVSLLRSQTLSDFFIYAGDDALILPIVACGGCGVVTVFGHLIGKEIKEMILAYQEGDVREALDIHLHFLELNNSLYTTTNPIPIKTALSMMGVMEDNFRLPMTKMDDKKRSALEATLREYELIPRRKG